MKEIYDYEEPYNTVILTGLVGLYEICFEQSWKMLKEILEAHGYEEGATGSPKIRQAKSTFYDLFVQLKEHQPGRAAEQLRGADPVLHVLH